MRNKGKIKLDALEVFLILIFIIMICGIFYFISNYITMNALLYNAIVFLLVLMTITVGAISIFQFVKMKYVETVKNEVKADMENYKLKIGDKIMEANSRIGHFETDYSKKLKKIMKDYAVKVREVEEIKKALDKKMLEIDRRTAELEVEACLLKIERLDKELRVPHYKRIVHLNDIYPGICEEEVLQHIYSIMNSIE